MIVHNLLLKLTNNGADNIERLRALLLSMRGRVEQLRELKVAANVRPTESNYDLALVAKFSSMEDFRAYLTHPEHVKVADRLKEELAAIASIQYED